MPGTSDRLLALVFAFFLSVFLALCVTVDLQYHDQRQSKAGVSAASGRRLRETIFLGGVVIGVAALGAVVLYGVTSWLWLVIHQGLH